MAIDLQQIGKRFKFYTNLKELDIDQLQEMTGSDRKCLENIMCGQNFLLDELVGIVKNFPDLNTQWLIYGEGSMFKPQEEAGKAHLKKDKTQYLKQMQEMLQELDAAEVAKDHRPDMEALRAKIAGIKDQEQEQNQ